MNEAWIWAGAAVSAGLLSGALVGAVLRRLLDRPDRRPAAREVARPLSLFAFWMLTATGAVVAVAVSSPARLEGVPTDVLNWLPNLAIAGLLLIGGYGLGITLAAGIGAGMERASGQRNRMIEAVVRGTLLVAASVLALRQIGVDTTLVDVVIAGVSLAAAAALAGIAIVGSRSVAVEVAAGRTVQRLLTAGEAVEIGDVTGVVDTLEAAHIVVRTTRGRAVIPYSRLVDAGFVLLDDTRGDPANGDSE